MATSITKVFIEQYTDTVYHLAQQMDSRIKPHVKVTATKGTKTHWDRLAAVGAPIDKTTRNTVSATFLVDDVWTRRTCTPSTKAHLMLLEPDDEVQQLHNPQSEYVKAQAAAIARSWDDLVIAAATAAVTEDGASVSFPAGQKVGTGAEVMSFDIVTQVQEKFMAQDITPDIPKVFCIGPVQVRKLLQLTEQTSADFVRREALQQLNATGVVPNWMGFTWVMTNRLLVPAASQISCLAFTPEALGLAINTEMLSRIGENPERSYVTQIFTQWTAAACRIQDEHIVHVHLADTV